jgi:hypothetical protein
MSKPWDGWDVLPIYLSNWSSHKTPGHHGPGRKLTIMARPRQWEHGDGRVEALTPRIGDLDAVMRGWITPDEYRARYVTNCPPLPALAPGRLSTQANLVAGQPIGGGPLVEDGDTLCCSCSRAAAARGECHRVWAAGLLAEAGWRVILDGKELGA